jgi:transposase
VKTRDGSGMARQMITNEMWEELKSLLPKPKGRPGRDNRRFLEAVYWVIRSGASWRDLPQEFGPWQTVYNRYNNWGKKGHLESILSLLKKRWRSRMAFD